ncbi:MAG: hypothetical protein WA063_05075 [Minisyncoccia bacterium]
MEKHRLVLTRLLLYAMMFGSLVIIFPEEQKCLQGNWLKKLALRALGYIPETFRALLGGVMPIYKK